MGGVVAAVGLLLVLTGCGSAAPRSTYTATVTVAPSSTPTATERITIPATPIGTPTPLASATSASAPAGQCADSVLTVAVTAGDPGAGTIYQDIVFTNTGSTACVLRGTPGVSVVGKGDGTQLGRPAARDQSAVKDVHLAADGGTATAQLRTVDIGDDGGPLDGCTVEKGGGLRIYPPHSFRAYFVRETGTPACVSGPSFMTVLAVH